MDPHPALAATGPDVLTRRVATLVEAGRTGAARPLLTAIRKLAPPSAELATLSARLAMREGNIEEARHELDAAVALSPNDAASRKLRAELRMQTDNRAGAAMDAAEAVLLDPADPAAKALLGVALLELGRATEAESCLAEAVRQAPSNPFFHEGLAAARVACGDPDGAEATLLAGTEAAPRVVSLRQAAILSRLRRGDFAGANALAEQARVAGVTDACIFGLQGHALASLGRHEAAGVAYHEALKLSPDDPYVRHLVTASGLLPSAERAPPEYLRAVFDDHAPRFEEHLLALGYRIPGLIRAALQRHLPGLEASDRVGPVLDLGCGTGLLAVVAMELPLGPWVGIDLSPRMLDVAREKGLYAELREADVLEALTGEQAWPVILAADVLCYFGALDTLFTRVAASLAPGGLFLFSVEERAFEAAATHAGDWLLGRQGRYAHERGYVQRAAQAAGLFVVAVEPATLRHEAGAAVPGLLVALSRP